MNNRLNQSFPGGLELALDRRYFARLDRIPLLQPAPGASIRRRKVYAVYFDTPHLRLRRHGLVLRMRRAGRGWLQAVGRGETSAAIPPSQWKPRQRLVAGPAPDLEAMPGLPWDQVLGDHAGQRKLKPAFIADYETTVRQVALPEARIEVSFERGWIRCGKRAERICALQLKLLSGNSWNLFEFALALREAVPFVVQGHSKIERGYALRRPGRLTPAKAGPSALTRQMSVSDAFCVIAAACVAQVQANQLGMLNTSDEEFLHQVRVAMRRLRSAIGLFKKAVPERAWASPLAELRALGAALGPARDWDVFVTERLPHLVAHFREQPGMAALARACAQARTSASARARRAVRSKRCQCFLLELSGSVQARTWMRGLNVMEREAAEQNVATFAESLLEDRYRQVRSRGRQIARLSDAKLHRLRIAVKKLRYAAEFFGPLFDQVRFKRFRAAATRLQEILGQINDAAVANRMLENLKDQRSPRALAHVRALVAGWNRHEVHRCKSDLVQAWSRFRKARVFWP